MNLKDGYSNWHSQKGFVTYYICALFHDCTINRLWTIFMISVITVILTFEYSQFIWFPHNNHIPNCMTAVLIVSEKTNIDKNIPLLFLIFSWTRKTLILAENHLSWYTLKVCQIQLFGQLARWLTEDFTTHSLCWHASAKIENHQCVTFSLRKWLFVNTSLTITFIASKVVWNTCLTAVKHSILKISWRTPYNILQWYSHCIHAKTAAPCYPAKTKLWNGLRTTYTNIQQKDSVIMTNKQKKSHGLTNKRKVFFPIKHPS